MSRFSRIAIIFILIGTIMIALSGFPYLQAQTRVIRLTDNLYPDAYPQMYGDILTWQGFIDPNLKDHEDGDWEIFLCYLPTCQVEQITFNKSDDLAPQTNGDYVVWQGESEVSSDIFLYHRQDRTITRITSDTSEDFFPKIWQDWIVWCAQPRAGEILQPGEIFLYQISKRKITLLSKSVDPDNRMDDVSPHIGYVQWSSADSRHKSLVGNLVLWFQGSAENSLSFLYNLDTGVIEPVPDGFIWPQTRQSDERLQVLSRRDMSGQDREIFLYQPATNQYHQLTNNDYLDQYPCLQTNKIAWMAGEGDSAEIFLAFYDANRPLNIPYDPHPLIPEDIPEDPVISPPDNSSDNSDNASGSNRASITPGSRCYIDSCRVIKR